MEKCRCVYCVKWDKIKKYQKIICIYTQHIAVVFGELPKLALPTQISNQFAIFWRENRFSECCVMKVPMMFPCFPSLRFWVLLKNFICRPKHVRKKCHQTCLQAAPAQTIPSKKYQEQLPFSKQCWRFECNHLHKQYLRARRTCHAQHVPLSPPFIISHTKKKTSQ